MILKEKLEKPYKDLTIRSNVFLICDYCGKEFVRIKKTRERLNKNISKDSCGEKQCSQKKREESNAKLYGDKHYFQSKDFKSKASKTNLLKYGNESYFQSDDFKDKRQQALIENYGVESPLQSDEILSKQQATCLERHGVSNIFLHPDFLENRKKTVLDKYGVDSVMQLEDSKRKRDETCLQKYGVKSYTQTDLCQEQKKQTCLKKYGVEHSSQLESNRDLAKQTCLEKYGVENYAQTEEFKSRYKKTCFERYGVPNPLCLPQNQKYGKTQSEITDWINSMGFSFSKNHKILEGKELDLYDADQNIAIEYCGLYWHTEFSPQPRDRSYHYSKYKKCKKQGIRLITLFSDEWQTKETQCKNIIRSILNKNKKIFARKCIVKQISKKEFKEFCQLHHLLGHAYFNLICFGLFFKDELVGGMSLGKHHRGKKGLVLDRLCFSDHQIVGGSSKLFKQCESWAQKNEYDSIISWSDNRWSEGNVYEQLGFSLDAKIPQDYAYVDLARPYKRFSKQSMKKSNTGCPKDVTERDWCLHNGLVRIWDCGKKRWKFNLTSTK